MNVLYYMYYTISIYLLCILTILYLRRAESNKTANTKEIDKFQGTSNILLYYTTITLSVVL